MTMAGGLVTAVTHTGGAPAGDERFPSSVAQPAESGGPGSFRAFAGGPFSKAGAGTGSSGAATAMANQLQQAAAEQAAQNAAAAGQQPEPIMVTPDSNSLASQSISRANPVQASLTSSDDRSTGTSVNTGTSTSTSSSADGGGGGPGNQPSSTATNTATATLSPTSYVSGPYSLSLVTSSAGWAGVCQKATLNILDFWGNTTPALSDLQVSLSADAGTLYSDSACSSAITSLGLSTGTSTSAIYFKTSATASLTASENSLGNANATVTISDAAASLAVGQADLVSSAASAATLSAPGAVLRINGKLVVADTANNRVLIWNSVPTSSGTAADVILGQPNATAVAANNGGVSAQSLSGPNGLASDGTHLVVSDSTNNRVLIWDTFPTSTQTAASHVVGQPNMTSFAANNGGLSGATLQSPYCVMIYSGALYVCDKANNRVLVWSSVPTGDGVAASFAVGQADLTHSAAAASATGLSAPYDAIVSNARLYVSDNGNNRVVIYPTVPSSSGATATIALGQTDLISNGSGLSTTTLNGPARLRVDSQGRLVVADSLNRRALVWNQEPTGNAAAADGVLGQPNFTSNTTSIGSPSATTLDEPLGIEISGSELWVSDSTNNRVVEFTLP